MGRRQAEALAASLADIDAIYSSDSQRARETAELVSASLDLTFKIDERLREVNFGAWEGHTRQEIDSRYAWAFSRWEAGERPLPAGVEADELMADRVLQALHELARAHPNRRVLVVTSGGPIRAAQAHLQGIDQTMARRRLLTVGNCELVEVVLPDR